jgi:argininosuccinate lyase
MDIRGPRLRKPSDEALAFTSSMAADARIARHVILVNAAHMIALIHAKEVDGATGAKSLRFLLTASGVRPGVKAEDFHQQLEQDAVDALGVETAGFMNYGKSRNDQVVTALRMELRARILDLLGAITDLQQALLKLAKKTGSAVFPGYTHLQRAQPVTLAFYLFAHFDAFQRDADRLLQSYQRVNLSPMGAAALAGTSAKVDRKFVAEILGFDGIVRNAMDAVSSRDIVVEALYCAVLTMLDASRLAEEQILWSSREFGFIELDDAYSASSSMMPQKKNAVSAELARAKAGSVLGSLVAVAAIIKALPYSYNLDLQEATPHLWRSFDDAVASLTAMTGSLSTMKVNVEAAREAVADDNSTAVALANHLVRSRKLSFRQAHAAVGELVRISIEKGIPLEKAAAAHLGRATARVGKSVNMDENTARRVLDSQNFLASISTQGGSNPAFIPADVHARQQDIASNRAKLKELGSKLRARDKKLLRLASGLAREAKVKS